jgi:hypothetical protein
MVFTKVAWQEPRVIGGRKGRASGGARAEHRLRGPRQVRRRRRQLVASMVAVALAAPAVVVGVPAFGGRAAAALQDLAGTWTVPGGTEFTFVTVAAGYEATYHGTAPHQRLVGTLTGGFDGTTYAGSLHITEDTVTADGTFTLTFNAGPPPTLTGTLDADNSLGNHIHSDVNLTCQSGACAKPRCSLVHESLDVPLTSIEEDLDAILSAALGPCDSIPKALLDRIRGGASRIEGGRRRVRAQLAKRFPAADPALLDSVASSLALGLALGPGGGTEALGLPASAFPGVRATLPIMTKLAANALKPPGDTTAATALANLVKIAVAIAPAPKPGSS